MNYLYRQVVFLLFNYNQGSNRLIVTLLQLRLRNLSSNDKQDYKLSD